MQGAIPLDGETGNPAVDQCDGARLELSAVDGNILFDDDLGIVEISHDRTDGALAGDDQYRQRQHTAQIGVGKPDGCKGTRGGHEHPRRAGGGTLAIELGGVDRVRGREYRGGERVDLRTTQGDTGVGQVGVDVKVAVPGVSGAAAGGRHSGPHQRDHQITSHHVGFGRCDDFGDRYRPGRRPDPDADGRRQSEPAVRGVVQRPRVRRGVDGAVLPGFVVVHQPEATAHNGVADLADGECSWYRAWPTQAHQPVRPGELVDDDAAVHPIQAVPQRQRLGVAQHLPDCASNHDPLTDRTAVDLHRFRRRGRGTLHRPGRQQMPGSLSGFGMRRVLLIDGQFVAYRAGGYPFPAGVDFDQRHHRTTTGRVDAQPVELVGDRRTLNGLPARRPGAVGELVGAPAQRGDLVGTPTHRVAVVAHQRRHLDPIGVEHPHRRSHRCVEVDGDDIGSAVRQRVPHHDRSGIGQDCPGQQLQSTGPRGCPQLPGVPPSGEQIQIHLVGLASGDRIMVSAPGELHPRLGQRGFGIARTGEQAGEHREPLGAKHGVLGGAVGLLGIDIRDVLAGVDRIHIPGLRRRCDSALGEFGTHGREEVRGNRTDKPRPGVPGVPVMVDIGDPGVRRGVVGTDRQQYIAGQSHRLQFRKQPVGGFLGLGQRRRGVHPPACRVMRRHVMRQQADTRGRDPLELTVELHSARITTVSICCGRHRTPLVIRPAGPRTRCQTSVGGHTRKLRIMAEHVELPCRGRVRTQHIALKTDAVHKVPNRGFRSGEVGVGFVVGTAHHLDATLGDKAQKVSAIFGMGIEIRLEVVDLGEHELIDRLPPGHLQVRGNECERIVLLAPAGRVLGPQAGVGALGVPPHRVVVEVTDHVHRPTGFGDDEFECELLRAGQHTGRPPPSGHSVLDRPVAGDGHRVAAQSVARHPHRGRPGRPGVGNSHELQRRCGVPNEQFGGLRRGHLHASNLRASHPGWGCDRRPRD